MRFVMIVGVALAGCGEMLAAPGSAGTTDLPVVADAGVPIPPAVPASSASGTAVARRDIETSDAAGASPIADGGCEILQHSNGLGQSYESCASLGTWDEAAAWAACEAYVAGATGGSCQLRSGGTCVGKAIVSVGMIARSATNAAWDFGTDVRGHVSTYPDAAPIGCPSASDPIWD